MEKFHKSRKSFAPEKRIMTELPFNSMDSIYELVDCLDEY